MAAWEKRSELRDPLDVLLAKERWTCKGCRFLHRETAFGVPVEICRLGKKKLRKCSLYGETS